MFLPGKNDEIRRATELAERRDAFQRIEQWCMEAIPSDIRDGVQISIQEVQCGDPSCAPIDTAVAILFPRYVYFFFMLLLLFFLLVFTLYGQWRTRNVWSSRRS
jgi:hypothetical protein